MRIAVVHPVVPISVLGLAAHDCAEAVSALTDSEDGSARVCWPRVQLSADMPFVMVRPRTFKNQNQRGSPVSENDSMVYHMSAVTKAWPSYLEMLTWWQLKRYFQRVGCSIKCKQRADVVVVHPVGRFTTASTETQWRDACCWGSVRHLP